MKDLVHRKTDMLLELGSASITSGKKKKKIMLVLLYITIKSCIRMKTEFKTKYSFAEQENKNQIVCLLHEHMLRYYYKNQTNLFILSGFRYQI